VNAQTRVLAVATVVAITATATACGSGQGTQRIGGTGQGISVEVPGSFSVLDLTSESTAVKSIAGLGLTSAVAKPLVQQVVQSRPLHPAMAVDSTGTVAKAEFADTIIAYCEASGTALTGSRAVPAIKKELDAQFAGRQANGFSTFSMPVGAVPGLETTYSLNSDAGPLAAGQLAVAPRPGKICFVTLTALPGTFSKSILATAARSAQFS
jgi:hypothetical protein